MENKTTNVLNTIQYPVMSPDILGGLSALLTGSSIDTTSAHGNSAAVLALTTCGTRTSSDTDGLISAVVRLGFSTEESDGSVLGTGSAS